METVYNGITGESIIIANRFGYPMSSIMDYRESEEKILFISSHIYHNEISTPLERFLSYYKNKIIGVIILDDKNFGESYGESIDIYRKAKIPILALWDKNITQEDINEIKGVIESWK